MSSRHRRTRSGAALIVALVALAVAGAVSMSMFKTALLRREHLQLAQRRAQADWLLHSAAQRAAARLAADPEYAGETWQPSLADLSSRARADVTIQVERAEASPDARGISLAVRYDEGGRLTQRSRQFVVAAPSPGAQP